MRHQFLRVLTFTFLVTPALANSNQSPLTPDWSQNATIDPTGRANPYGWDEATLQSTIRQGQIRALNYPIATTGLLVPARSTLKILNSKPGDPLFGFIKTVLSLSGDFPDFKGFYEWMGLHDYPETDAQIPYPEGTKPDYPMGVSFVTRGKVKGMTFGCAACHSGAFLGKPILGITNQFPQANLLFVHGQTAMKNFSPGVFALFTGANKDEKAMYAETSEKIKSVGVKRPTTIGLDTSLAQVALSLAKRAQTPWAERTVRDAENPRPNLMDHLVADSKPSVWWNLKYKTRWLSDGSVVSGNPIFTNFLWNEIGRGADLLELTEWLEQNSSIVEELTTAVFATQAPKWREYLPENNIQIERAKRGEILFAANCAHCHGTYDKAWSLSNTEFANAKSKNPDLSLLDTIKVTYHSKTPNVDVGTDPGRRKGMAALADGLNPLAFSKNYNIVIEEQKGYTPPPLDGIFVRFPYFHNNSIPNLCALMTPPAERPETYTSGKVLDANIDYDQTCVGYPTGVKTPIAWLKAKDATLHLFDTKKEGLSNDGHYEKIFTTSTGAERYSPDQKVDLIEYLKTL